MLALPIVALLLQPSLPGETFTNEEEVYFAKDKGAAPPPWLALRIESGRTVAVDAFGAPLPALPAFKTEAVPEGLRATLADGSTTLLRRARPATCWAAIKRAAPKPDGGEDWAFTPGIALHDQGGRAAVGGNGAPAAVIRMRNVIWPSGNNRPSLVLYIHTPDAPDHAVSYVWADPGAARIGVNLRWIQASCTIDGREAPTPATSRKGGTE